MEISQIDAKNCCMLQFVFFCCIYVNFVQSVIISYNKKEKYIDISIFLRYTNGKYFDLEKCGFLRVVFRVSLEEFAMKLTKANRCLVAAVLAASTALTILPANAAEAVLPQDTEEQQQILQAAAVSIQTAVGYENAAYVTWAPVADATGYHVYCDGTQIDTMLIRQYASYFRADVVGLTEGVHTLEVVPVKDGKEDAASAAEAMVTASAYDRTGFAFTGTDGSCGAYQADGTLKKDAVVLYVTEKTKDTVSMDVVTSAKGATTTATGIQEILNAYKKGYDSRPLAVRFIGTITDPAVTEGGDLLLSGNSDSKRLSCGITLEGIGEDATIRGFGIRAKNISSLEIRNLAVMLVDSGEGDNYSLQQSCDHVWVHNCDSFYGLAGSDADQAKGDGALDCKKSTYVTFSYNHFWDNGKCNLLGLSEETTDGLYITYHHNWYDHSDSRHPRVRFYSAHVYNNYYDGNAKYGIGATRGCSIFAEGNYFRNCKYPMLSSMQGSDVETGGTFSNEDAGVIKAYGNYMEGQKLFTSYSEDSTEFDAYVASSREEKVPSSVKTKPADGNKIKKGTGNNTYNNFDTDASVMYSYTADAAEDVPKLVTEKAGRLNGGDFQFTFTEADDTDYSVNAELMAALKAYQPSVIAIGGDFQNGGTVVPGTTTTPVVTTTASATTTTKITTVPSGATTAAVVTTQVTPVTGALYCAPGATGSGTMEDPMDVLTAIEKVQPGQTIYLLEGTYAFDSTILISDTNCGTADAYKNLSAYPGADVTFDFSAMEIDPSNRGFVLDGDYWHFYGFEITKAGDNGMLLSGDHNKIERMIFNNNQDSGLQISRYKTSNATIDTWPSDNLILNCTAKNNCDDKTMENADGFAAKLTCGEGNVFDGCMSYNNSDDGWDLFAKTETGPTGVVTLQNCVAFRNGRTEDGRGDNNCDGNGFKLGGSSVPTAHVVKNCLAFENLHHGFTDNSNPQVGSLSYCTSYNNSTGGGKANFQMDRGTNGTTTYDHLISYTGSSSTLGSDKFIGTISNAIFYNSKKYWDVADATAVNNKSVGTNVSGPTDSDFISVTAPAVGTDFDTVWRNADGSINVHGFMQVAETSNYYTYRGAVLGDSSSIDPPITTTVTTGTAATTTTKTTVTTAGGQQTTTQAPVTTTGKTAAPSNAFYGDVNLDNTVSLADLITFQKQQRGAIDFNAQQLANADCDQTDGTGVDSIDVTALLEFLIGRTDTLPKV